MLYTDLSELEARQCRAVTAAEEGCLARIKTAADIPDLPQLTPKLQTEKRGCGVKGSSAAKGESSVNFHQHPRNTKSLLI